MEMFRVPQKQVEVHVQLESGLELEGVFYTATASPVGGPGRLSERLNDESERFLPLASQPLTYLLNKHWIVTVRVMGDAEQGEQEQPSAAGSTEMPAKIKLANGLHVEGRLPYLMPPDRPRLLDYLNTAPRFIPIQQDEGQLTWVNRDFITTVVSTAE